MLNLRVGFLSSIGTGRLWQRPCLLPLFPIPRIGARKKKIYIYICFVPAEASFEKTSGYGRLLEKSLQISLDDLSGYFVPQKKRTNLVTKSANIRQFKIKICEGSILPTTSHKNVQKTGLR